MSIYVYYLKISENFTFQSSMIFCLTLSGHVTGVTSSYSSPDAFFSFAKYRSKLQNAVWSGIIRNRSRHRLSVSSKYILPFSVLLISCNINLPFSVIFIGILLFFLPAGIVYISNLFFSVSKTYKLSVSR